MGLFWDLIQQSQIGDQRASLGTLEERVRRLEDDLRESRRVQAEVIRRLERHLKVDLDADGVTG